MALLVSESLQGELVTDNDQNLKVGTVRALLDAAGLLPSPDEVSALGKAYPLVRAMCDDLYAVAEARYEIPALHFEPRPLFTPWAPDPEAMNFHD